MSKVKAGDKYSSPRDVAQTPSDSYNRMLHGEGGVFGSGNELVHETQPFLEMNVDVHGENFREMSL